MNKNEGDTCNWDARCYIKGKWFENLEEGLKYEIKWRDKPIDLEDFKRFLEQRYREAEVNSEINPNLTNRSLYKMLRDCTEWVEDEVIT